MNQTNLPVIILVIIPGIILRNHNHIVQKGISKNSSYTCKVMGDVNEIMSVIQKNYGCIGDNNYHRPVHFIILLGNAVREKRY